MKHLVVVADWKDEFPFEAAAECHAKWGSLYVSQAENPSDAVVWVFSDKFMTDVGATMAFMKEEEGRARRDRR